MIAFRAHNTESFDRSCRNFPTDPIASPAAISAPLREIHSANGPGSSRNNREIAQEEAAGVHRRARVSELGIADRTRSDDARGVSGRDSTWRVQFLES
jgi:hypothetical protein